MGTLDDDDYGMGGLGEMDEDEADADILDAPLERFLVPHEGHMFLDFNDDGKQVLTDTILLRRFALDGCSHGPFSLEFIEGFGVLTSLHSDHGIAVVDVVDVHLLGAQHTGHMIGYGKLPETGLRFPKEDLLARRQRSYLEKNSHLDGSGGRRTPSS